MKEHILSTNKVYLLVKLSQTDANAKQNFEKDLAQIVCSHFGIFVLMKIKTKVLSIANSDRFFILETIKRDLGILMFSMNPGITKNLGFTVKILKVSSFLSDLTHMTNGTFVIDVDD